MPRTATSTDLSYAIRILGILEVILLYPVFFYRFVSNRNIVINYIFSCVHHNNITLNDKYFYARHITDFWRNLAQI